MLKKPKSKRDETQGISLNNHHRTSWDEKAFIQLPRHVQYDCPYPELCYTKTCQDEKIKYEFGFEKIKQQFYNLGKVVNITVNWCTK